MCFEWLLCLCLCRVDNLVLMILYGVDEVEVM